MQPIRSVVTDEHILFSLLNCRWDDEIKFVNIYHIQGT